MDSDSSKRTEAPRRVLVGAVLGVVLFANAACVTTRTPTISHVHVGHVLTAHPATPTQEGFLVVAGAEAAAAREIVAPLSAASDAATARRSLTTLDAHLHKELFPFTVALRQGANHLTFAGQADDSTANVSEAAGRFEQSVQGVFVRSELIDDYLEQATSAETSDEEVVALAMEIRKLVIANVEGEDLNGNGVVGDQFDEYGVAQLRRDVDAMVAAENPPYVVADRWYLFNIFRLPGGGWAFRDRNGT